MHVIFAFVGENLIEKYGAYAGFAAIPGLAVMALLYFAQAREVKRLREWAEGIATGRDALPAQRPATAAAQQQQRPVPKPPVPRPAPAKPSLGPPKPAAAAAAAAAAGNAAAANANDKKDADDVEKPAAPDAKPVPAGVPAATAAAAAKGAEVDEVDDVEAADREREPAVAGASAGAPTALRERGSAPPPAPGHADTDGGGSPDRPGPPRSARPSSPNLGRPVSPPRSAAALRSGRPSATIPPRAPSAAARFNEDEPRRRPPIAVIVGGIVILLVGVVLAVTLLGGGDDGKPAGNTIEGEAPRTQTDEGGTPTTPRKKEPAAPVDRSAVTIAVLNGTTAPGLAATVGDQLEGEGFRRGTVANASDQQQQATTVFYGPDDKRAAQEVAKILKVSSVKPLDAGTQAIAGADAGVVVVVGADRTS